MTTSAAKPPNSRLPRGLHRDRGMMHPMGIVYLAALILGGGTILLQLLAGGDGHDGADADGDHGDQGGHGGHGDAGLVPIFLSLRFWTFGLLGFGLAGSLLHYLGLA